MERVLVTGGAGFIGSHIVERFLGRGCEVLVLDDLSSGKVENVSPQAELIQADIRSEAATKALIEFKPQITVHAAAQISVRRSMEEPAVDSEINVCGVANLLHAAAQLEEKPFFVFISTGGAIYGEQETFPAPELHPIKPVSLYGLNKYVGELYFDFWQRSYGIPYAALRLSNVYGPRQNPHGEAGVVAIFCEMLNSGKTPTIYGSGAQTRDFIFVLDVVNAVEAAAVNRKSGTFNVGTGIESTVLQIFEGLAKEFGRDVKPQFAPERAGEQLRSVIDPAYSSEALGWRPSTSVAEGLKKTAAWYREE